MTSSEQKKISAWDTSMIKKCNTDELMQMDFTVDKIPCVDTESGEQFSAEVLDITLGYSGLTYVQTLESQKQEVFIIA